LASFCEGRGGGERGGVGEREERESLERERESRERERERERETNKKKRKKKAKYVLLGIVIGTTPHSPTSSFGPKSSNFLLPPLSS
jgi:hypothetical protein